MRIEQHLEMTVSESMDKELTELLQHAFPSIYPNRRYFKQLPHFRLIAYADERIIGQVGLDFRVMNVNGEPIHVLGIIDLCVREEVRGRGVGRALMDEVDVDAVDLGDELVEPVEGGLARTPVVFVGPVLAQFTGVRQRHPLRPVVDHLGIGPARRVESSP